MKFCTLDLDSASTCPIELFYFSIENRLQLTIISFAFNLSSIFFGLYLVRTANSKKHYYIC